MYIFGGFDHKGRWLDDFYTINVSDLIWKRIRGNGPGQRAYSTLTELWDGIILFGGLNLHG